MESQTNSRKTTSRAKWQWKSNSDPWSKSEEPQWTSYSLEQNYLIEKAYHDQRKEVDLGDYIVSIQHMIQDKKGNITLQRPIRRIAYEEEEEIEMRNERYYESELPKSINKIFGSLGDFINFFSRRNSEILDLAKQFQVFEQSNDLNGLNNIIRPQLISCLEKGLLGPIEVQLQDDTLSRLQKKLKLESKKRSEDLISLFQKEFASFEEFYGFILRSYTMNTDLYLHLNRYLRNESWTAIDNLLPYAICLCKAFFSFKNLKQDKSSENKPSITVYRGTAFDKLALSSYQTGKVSKLFSWNSVTSTSKNLEMAKKFMYVSANVENKIYPVLFIIEIPELIESEYAKWIDIHQYSAIPNEDEVILPPGSVFELEEISTDVEERAIIKLKLKHDVESLAYGGLIMQGALQNEMLNDSQVKIVSLEGEELSEVFKSLSGNRLIEEIEICLCTFDHKSLEGLLYALPTLEKAKRLKFVSCKLEHGDIISSLKLQNPASCNILEVEIFEIQEISRIFSSSKAIPRYWNLLRELKINFTYSTQVENFSFQGFEYLSQLASLSLDFCCCEKVTDEGVNNLASQGIKFLTQLVSLTLDFSYCDLLTNQSVNLLVSHGLKHLTQLSSLSLNFLNCAKITSDEFWRVLSQWLESFTKLTNLVLNNNPIKLGCDEHQKHQESKEFFPETLKLRLIRKKPQQKLMSSLDTQQTFTSPLEEKNLKQAEDVVENILSTLATFGEGNDSANLNRIPFKYLSKTWHLTSLTLDFAHDQITDSGLKRLVSQWLRYLTRLSSLSLNFKLCDEVTDKGINYLASQGLKDLTKLASLQIEFSSRKITSQGLNNLISHGTKFLKQLSSLGIIISDYDITSGKVKDLISQGFKSLPHFTSLTLDFDLSSTGTMDYMIFQVLPHLIQLTSLNLNLYCSLSMTDEGLDTLTTQVLIRLTQLTSLTLCFSGSEITNKGVELLATQGLKYLTQLTSLILDFSACSEITNQGVDQLASQGLRYLIRLTSLAINFFYCNQIRDEGMNLLISHGIKYLNQLTTLTLVWNRCRAPEFTTSNIIRILHYFGFHQEEPEKEIPTIWMEFQYYRPSF